MQNLKRKDAGISLVEIAIVLVIMSLILVITLKLAELYRSAQLRAGISELNELDRSFFDFNDRYKCKGNSNIESLFAGNNAICKCSVPGVTKNPNAVCLGCFDNSCRTDNQCPLQIDDVEDYVCLGNVCPISAPLSQNSSILLVNSSGNNIPIAVPGDLPYADNIINGATNGNGDGIIDANERMEAMQQMVSSGILNFPFDDSSTVFNPNETAMRSSLGSNAAYIYEGDTSANSSAGSAILPPRRNNPNYILAGKSNGDANTLPLGTITPREARKIDTKIDDGVGNTGKVHGLNEATPTANTCLDSTGDYNGILEDNRGNRVCRLRVWLTNFDLTEELDNEDIRFR